ncbi:MAG: aminotransferase class IV [Candidatus Aminicenantes bacterium]|jgi:branched-subunit amino acid aminotransferase/4-amino-4-deoxychorismate lyase
MTQKLNTQETMLKRFIPVNDLGVSFGYGLFETLRLYESIPFLLEPHLDRLIKSSRTLLFLNMPGKEQLKQSLLAYIKEKGLRDQALRLSVTFGNQADEAEGIEPVPRVFITHRPIAYGPSDYEKGITAAISAYRKNPYSPIVQHKTFNQLENILAQRPGKDQRVKECILLNTSGYIAEGSKSNLFFVRDGRVYTPSIDCGLLPGITRKQVIDLLIRQGVRVLQGKYRIEEMQDCDECFCSNSLMEVIPITKIDGQWVGSGHPGQFSRLALSLYRQSVQKYKV